MLVSIITPTYNRADLLPETIESILSQDYPHIEYLVLDDGSSDNTQEVLARYAGRIRIDRHPNMGETRTVNKGFEMVTGDIICVVSSDDPLLPGAVAEAVNAFRAHPEAVAVYPDWATIDECGNVLREERLEDYDLETMLLKLNWGIGPGAFFTRGALAKVGPRDLRYTYCGDMEFWVRMAAHGSLIHIPKILATHRVHRGSASVSQRGRKMATEWIDVIRRTLSHPALSAALRREKHRILLDAYRIAASHYCAGDLALARVYKRRSVVHKLLYTSQNPRVLLERPIRRLRAFVAQASNTNPDAKLSLRALLRFTARRFLGIVVRRLITLAIIVLRLWLRIPKRQSNTNGSASGRFAFCTRFLPPMWSGQAVVIGRLLAGLPPDYYCFATQPVHQNRHDNDFIGALPGKYYDLPPEKRIPTGRVSDYVRYGNLLWGILQRGTAMARALKYDSVDTLIGCTGDLIDPPATFLAARILRCRYFMYFFDDFTEQWWADPAIQKVIRRFERVLALRADGLISPNEYMQQELLKRYQKPSFVVRNPTPRLRPPEAEVPFPSDEGEIKLVFTGAIYHLNYDIFRNIIAAIGQLARPNVRLHLYTAQPADELIRQGLDGPHVVIHSHLPPADALEVQRKADILLIPFSFQPEAQGIVRTSATAKLADYLMTGRPLLAICHRDSFLGWYLEEYECGMLVASEEPSAIAGAIRAILEDPGLRERLRRNAVDRAKTDFAPDRAQSDLLQAINLKLPTIKSRRPHGSDALYRSPATTCSVPRSTATCYTSSSRNVGTTPTWWYLASSPRTKTSTSSEAPVWNGSTGSPGWRKKRSPRTACCRCLRPGSRTCPASPPRTSSTCNCSTTRSSSACSSCPG
jgi:glycosyltransferase involved in cell wall biosynthesis